MCVFFGGVMVITPLSFKQTFKQKLNKKIMNIYITIIGIYLAIGMACYFFLTQESSKQKSSLFSRLVFVLISPIKLIQILLAKA